MRGLPFKGLMVLSRQLSFLAFDLEVPRNAIWPALWVFIYGYLPS